MAKRTNFRTKSITLVAGATCALGMALGGTAATAQPQAPSSAPAASVDDQANPLSAQDEEKLRDELTAMGVEADVQDGLVAKWEAGEMWDSLNPDAEPVSTDTARQAGVDSRIETFADGSVIEHEVQIPEGEVGYRADAQVGPEQPAGSQPAGISECAYSSTQYSISWRGCKANVNLGIISKGFYYDRDAVQGGYDKITRAWGNHHHCIGCSLSSHRIEKFSDQNYRYSSDLDVAFKGFPVGWTAYMGVQINNGTATTYNN